MTIIAKGTKSNKPKLLGHVDHGIPRGGDHRNMYQRKRLNHKKKNWAVQNLENDLESDEPTPKQPNDQTELSEYADSSPVRVLG